MKNRENKLLFIGNTRLGDCIMSTGLLDDLCEFYQAKATVICGALGEDIYSRYPFTEKVITLRKQIKNSVIIFIIFHYIKKMLKNIKIIKYTGNKTKENYL